MPQRILSLSRLQTSALFLFIGLTWLLTAAPSPCLAGKTPDCAQGNAAHEPKLPGYEPAEPDPALQEERQSIERLEKRINELQKRMNRVRNKALDNNPELETQLKDLIVTTNEVLQRKLADENVDLERLKELEKKRKKEGLAQEEKNKLKKEIKEMYLGYERAKMRASQNKTVQKLWEQYQSDMLEACKAVNPEVEQISKELDMLKHMRGYAKEEAVPENKGN